MPSARFQPLIGDTRAAGKSDASVDDQQLAVRPVVQAMKPVPRDRLVEVDLAARLAQAPHRPPIKALPTASSVNRTSTPARARSTMASISMSAAAPRRKIYASMFTDDCAARIAPIAG